MTARVIATAMLMLMIVSPVAAAEEVPIRKPYTMPAESMLPTLRVREVFWANPVAYKTEPPERGDVIVLRGPGDLAYVKRVVGIGGDTLSITEGVLTLNGETAVLARLPMTLTDPPRNAQMFAEGVPGGYTARILNLHDNAQGDTYGPVKVPEGHVFVMGDNRDNSNDSRFSLGMVPLGKVIGKATIILFSSDFRRIGLPVE